MVGLQFFTLFVIFRVSRCLSVMLLPLSKYLLLYITSPFLITTSSVVHFALILTVLLSYPSTLFILALIYFIVC